MHRHKRQSASKRAKETWYYARYEWFLLDFILEIMTDITTDKVTSLATHFNRLHKMKQSVMGALEGDIAEKSGIAEEKRVHGIDVMCCETLEVCLLMLLSTFIDVF